MRSSFTQTFQSGPAANPLASAQTLKAAQRRRLRIFGSIILLLTASLTFGLSMWAARHRADLTATAGQVYADHHFSRTRPRIAALVDSRIYNLPQTKLNQSIVLSMRVAASRDVASRMHCRPPGRPQFKAHITAPTFDTQTALDDVITPSSSDQWFEWILTGKQVGLQEVLVRGILYCASPGGAVTIRQTVVDQIRGIVVAQPFVLSSDNVVGLAIAVLGLLGSAGGLFTLIAGLLHPADPPSAVNGTLRGETEPAARRQSPDAAAAT